MRFASQTDPLFAATNMALRVVVLLYSLVLVFFAVFCVAQFKIGCCERRGMQYAGTIFTGACVLLSSSSPSTLDPRPIRGVGVGK